MHRRDGRLDVVRAHHVAGGASIEVCKAERDQA
jgi:hypothetical protein